MTKHPFQSCFQSLYPDLWPSGGTAIMKASEYDIEYFGAGTVRIKTYLESIPTLPVKITITSRHNTLRWGMWMKRCKIEFLKDGEPSDFTGGWIEIK